MDIECKVVLKSEYTNVSLLYSPEYGYILSGNSRNDFKTLHGIDTVLPPLEKINISDTDAPGKYHYKIVGYVPIRFIIEKYNNALPIDVVNAIICSLITLVTKNRQWRPYISIDCLFIDTNCNIRVIDAFCDRTFNHYVPEYILVDCDHVRELEYMWIIGIITLQLIDPYIHIINHDDCAAKRLNNMIQLCGLPEIDYKRVIKGNLVMINAIRSIIDKYCDGKFINNIPSIINELESRRDERLPESLKYILRNTLCINPISRCNPYKCIYDLSYIPDSYIFRIEWSPMECYRFHAWDQKRVALLLWIHHLTLYTSVDDWIYMIGYYCSGLIE